MKPEKICVVGKGTVGATSVAQLLNETDAEIEWVFDNSISTTSVGEGTTLTVPSMLKRALSWDSCDLSRIGGTPKLGIWKENWGVGNKFLHPFPLGSYGMHMSATMLQEDIFNLVKDNPRVTVKDENVSDPSSLDADGVLVCSGTPKDYSEYNTIDVIPVNSCYVTQCYWDYPKFNHTLTIARPYGWVFGIPLANRCSIGYLYNKDINTLQEVKEDVVNIFKQFGLEPSEDTNSLTFNSYYRKNNFQDRVVYNGNASFFVEPLEATSTSSSIFTTNMAVHHWRKGDVVFQDRYESMITDVAKMIALHYASGSVFNTKFWEYAKGLALGFLSKELKDSEDKFSEMIMRVLEGKKMGAEVGTWTDKSYKINIDNLGIKDTLLDLLTPNYEGKAA